ncbi:hypothetical protein GBA52_003761 [Prunus armeniaca]|nr:hypothetical protein GBA52_003761 [Prunus armeniaca]
MSDYGLLRTSSSMLQDEFKKVDEGKFFNLPERQRIKLGDKCKESLRHIIQEENGRNMAMTKHLLVVVQEVLQKHIEMVLKEAIIT